MASLDKDQFDALMKLAEFKRAVREGRRQFEWRFTATAFLALAGLSIFPQRASVWVIAAAAVLICVVHTRWVAWNSESAERDRVEMYNYKDAAEKMLPPELQYFDPKRRRDPLSFLEQRGVRFQIFSAYGIAVFSIIVRLLSSGAEIMQVRLVGS